jgi:NAD(P)-dependent dehydrogenase (short-subunit alcohol dehydrogenase family)
MNQKVEQEKVALVTGASSGIGQAAAIELARRGFHVAVHYFTNEKGARDTFDRIRSFKHARARVYTCDVTDPTQVSQMAGDVLLDFGRIDALVNNAGSMFEQKALLETDFELWRRIMASNLDSVYLITHAFLPYMIEKRSGAIVNVASIAGRTGDEPGSAAYAAAKGAVISLTKAMAREFLPYGIRVNAVNPGIINTPGRNRFTAAETLQKLVSEIPIGRMGTSEEIAKIIAFLISDEASYLAGECVEANGGLLME